MTGCFVICYHSKIRHCSSRKHWILAELTTKSLKTYLNLNMLIIIWNRTMAIRTYICNLVHIIRFWNNLYRVHSTPRHRLEIEFILKALAPSKPKDVNRKYLQATNNQSIVEVSKFPQWLSFQVFSIQIEEKNIQFILLREIKY
jgi:hypothetical protein